MGIGAGQTQCNDSDAPRGESNECAEAMEDYRVSPPILRRASTLLVPMGHLCPPRTHSLSPVSFSPLPPSTSRTKTRPRTTQIQCLSPSPNWSRSCPCMLNSLVCVVGSRRGRGSSGLWCGVEYRQGWSRLAAKDGDRWRWDYTECVGCLHLKTPPSVPAESGWGNRNSCMPSFLGWQETGGEEKTTGVQERGWKYSAAATSIW
jgi:hypothetical protein